MRDDEKFTSLLVPYRLRSSRPFTILDAALRRAPGRDPAGARQRLRRCRRARAP